MLGRWVAIAIAFDPRSASWPKIIICLLASSSLPHAHPREEKEKRVREKKYFRESEDGGNTPANALLQDPKKEKRERGELS